MNNLTSLEAIFFAAIEKPAAERAAYLDDACRGDADLRLQVERLLAAHPRVGGFLDAAPNGPITVDDTPIAEKPGTIIGPYKLMEQIGEGGMGLVFVAEQLEPIRRKVALKIIKPGMDTRDVIARFEAERQALALMDHPNIARVLDAGTTGSEPEARAREAQSLACASGSVGRPYFVMELVRGIPITDYCDQNQLTPRERLGLFHSVCQAVQHAHQKGIIHRDLKPSNILVTSHDGTPVVKVIDFGVAKAIGQHLTDKTIYTRFTQMIGTPLYMSPEQAEMSGLDIDTRSDIYALGVLLYELLTGTTPFDGERLKKAAFDEIRRIIREEEPPKPSKRLTTLGATLPAVSAKRKTDAGKLAVLVAGDLDWIVMKALEKDRTRRYASADALARDLERYLKDEPVEACPPSRWYLLRKFTRRNKRRLASVAIFLTLLIAGTTVSIWQAVRAEQAEQRARRERDASQAALEFLHDLVFNPIKAGESDLRKALDRASPQIDARFGQQPLTEARVRLIVGEAYTWLGANAEAVPQFVRAREISLREYGPEHYNTLVAEFWLSNTYRSLGKTDLAEPLANDGLERARRTLGDDNILTLQFRHQLGVIRSDRGRLPEAEAMLTEAIAGLERIPHKLGAWELATTRDFLAFLYKNQKRWHESELLFRKVEQQYREELGANSTTLARVQADLGRVLLEQKKYAEAEPVLRQCLAIRAEKLPGRWEHCNTQSMLGEALAGQRKFAEAESRLLAAEMGLVKLGPPDPKDEGDRPMRLREFRARLVRLYEAWDRPEDAAQWRKQLDTPPQSDKKKA